MIRLDSLTQDELNKLYTRSALLSQLGTLWMIVTIISSIVALFVSPWILLSSIFLFAAAYVFKYVRTPLARIYFYVWSISGIVLAGLSFLSGFFASQDGASAIGAIMGGIIHLLICIGVLESAKTDALFGADYFSHNQIACARKKKRNNETFSDEEFPKSLPNPLLAKICVVIAFILEGLLILVGLFKTLFR